MLTLRKSQDRGYADHGWLKSFHSFSFAGYHHPKFMGWGNLRVINEDRVAAGMGFGKHSHRNMEIISYVLSGNLAHEDDMGNVESIPPGDIQRMSAGSGVTHSEFNHAQDQTTHFLQIWIEPNALEIEPGYEQKSIPAASKEGALCLVASPEGLHNAVKIHADARIYLGLFNGAQSETFHLNPQRKAYVHLIKGVLSVNHVALEAGDALLIENESQLDLCNGVDAEVLVFDLSR
ncbi:pirin family protein [Polynucleobacter sp. TUM22923]|uniref:pirin family protein n=1 Tax=Polynucleobacter sp. TUM22923 TaxID=3022126 RepID=UPI002572757C|nr:pirin family protein [Polynucleobacter sp. TUM22923]BDX21192.1 pirin family protein [Polynucleobacter sp. TUM22923]